MKMIFVHGLGCVESGARGVFISFIQELPKECGHYVVICTSETKKKLTDYRVKNSDIVFVGLNHKVWGRWLRLPLEVGLGLLAMMRIIRIVNFSHYGFCFGGNYSLFFHSEPLLDDTMNGGWSEGRPNYIKRWMLDSCFNRAKVVLVQTDHIRSKILKYSNARGFNCSNLKVCRPLVRLIRGGRSIIKKYDYQLFYPASRFAHKRTDLAIHATRLAALADSRVGLVITTNGNSSGVVCEIGPQELETIHAYLSVSDALLFTSERESLGLPLLEALAAGIPIIAPRLPYAKELLGDAGIYFDRPTPIEISEAILSCIERKNEFRDKILSRWKILESESYSFSKQWELLLG